MHKLTENHFSFKCPMNWDAMEASDNGRFCSKCRKEVFDLTNCSIDEVIALQRKHGPICGSIKIAVAAISLSAAACQDKSSTQKPEQPASTSSITHLEDTIRGKICAPEQLEKKDQK